MRCEEGVPVGGRWSSEEVPQGGLVRGVPRRSEEIPGRFLSRVEEVLGGCTDCLPQTFTAAHPLQLGMPEDV